MWLCAAMFYSFQFLIRVSPNVMTHQLMASFDVQACALGTVISFYYWGYSLMQIPAGVMLDSFGPRRPLTVACLLCFIGCIIFGMGTNIYMLSVGRAMMGIGSAFGFLTAVRIISTWFHAEKLGLFVGLSVMIGTLGAISGSRPLGILISLTSWQTCMYILAAFSAFLGVMSWLIVRDTGPQEKDKRAKIPFSLTHIVLSLVDIAKNPQTWIYALYGFLMYVPLSAFADLWGTSFIAQKFQIDHNLASGGIFTFYVGVSIGSALLPIIVNRIESYKKVMMSSAFGTAFFLGLAFYMSDLTFFQSCILLGCAGVFSGGQFIAFSGITDINPRDRAATASGMHNMLCMFSGNLMQPLVGSLLQFNWTQRGGTYLTGTPHYMIEDFHYAFAIIPVCVLAAGVIIYWAKETYNNAKTF